MTVVEVIGDSSGKSLVTVVEVIGAVVEVIGDSGGSYW